MHICTIPNGFVPKPASGKSATGLGMFSVPYIPNSYGYVYSVHNNCYLGGFFGKNPTNVSVAGRCCYICQ